MYILNFFFIFWCFFSRFLHSFLHSFSCLFLSYLIFLFILVSLSPFISDSLLSSQSLPPNFQHYHKSAYHFSHTPLTISPSSSPRNRRICPPLRSTPRTLTHPTKQHMGKRNVLILSIHHNVRMMTANQSLTNPSSQVAGCKVHQRYVGESEALSMMGRFALICEAVYCSIRYVIVRTTNYYKKNFTSNGKSRPFPPCLQLLLVSSQWSINHIHLTFYSLFSSVDWKKKFSLSETRQ